MTSNGPDPSRDEPARETTERLAERARKDPAQVFPELYARVAPALYAWASLHVREPLRARLDPEDVVQEITLRTWQRFGEYEPASASFRAWSFGIARNVLHEAFRRLATRSAGRPEALSTEQLSAVPEEATSISQRLVRDEALRGLIEALERLPEEERRLVLYRGLEELPHDEVARLLGLSPEAAAKRWQRLRERLSQSARMAEFLAA